MKEEKKSKKSKALIPWTMSGAHGFVAVPMVLIRNKGRLGLDDDELALIVAIMSHKWDDAAPWPSVATLAAYLGWDVRKVQRARSKLEGKHKTTKNRRPYLVTNARKKGPNHNETNTYDFTPLLKALVELEATANKQGVVEDGTSAGSPDASMPLPTGTSIEASHALAQAEVAAIKARIAELEAQRGKPGNDAVQPKQLKKMTFGRARYEVETFADDLEATISDETRARADAQAEDDWRQTELTEWVERIRDQYLTWNLPGHWRLEDARIQAQYDGLTEEEEESLRELQDEARAERARDFWRYLATDGVIAAIMGIEPYCNIDFSYHFPESFPKAETTEAKETETEGTSGTPPAAAILDS